MKQKEGPLSPDANPLFSDPSTIPPVYWQKLEDPGFSAGADIRREGDVLSFRFLAYDCRVDIASRAISADGFPGRLSFQTYLLILSWLGSDRKQPLPDLWCLATELKGGIHFFDRSHPLTVDRVIEGYRGCEGQLEKAFMTLGGTKLSAGDIGYDILVLPGIRLRYIYWEGDDEFPPALTVNFQKGVEEIIAPDVIWAMVNVVNDAIVALGRQDKPDTRVE